MRRRFLARLWRAGSPPPAVTEVIIAAEVATFGRRVIDLMLSDGRDPRVPTAVVEARYGAEIDRAAQRIVRRLGVAR